jgi:hypothetical protein
MPTEDYFECRAFDLTVSIFNNGGTVREFFRLAETLGIRRSVLLDRIYRGVRQSNGPLAALYRRFKEDEARNFFASQEDLDAFLGRPGAIDAYLSGQYGINHIYMTRAIALMQHFRELAAFAREALRTELSERGLLDDTLRMYIEELYDVMIASKTDVTQLDTETTLYVHFDFVTLRENDFRIDPRTVATGEALPLHVKYSSGQRADLNRFLRQFGRDVKGMAYLIQRNDVHLSAVLYRSLSWSAAASVDACVLPPAAVSLMRRFA